MDVIEFGTAEEFLEASRQFRANEPYLTNVIGSVAHSVTRGRRYDACHWFIARDQGQVVGLAMRTLPHNLMISPMSEPANAAMAAAVAQVFPDLPGFSGPLSQMPAFQSALGAVSAETSMTEVVYVLGAFTPAVAAGVARRVNTDDVELLRTWLFDFAVEARLPTHDIEAGVARMLDVGWLWEHDGKPVAMCGYAGPVGDAGTVVGRVGPVYTEPTQRGRGFGGAVTSAVVEQLQQMCEHIMLYADASNPTSNGVYQRLGFVEYARTGQVQFRYA
ncbi:MAG: GNAT family N-acetyltransferase [Actinobacteria bacterium]|nr:GNAT family N-acetyltransferase [Actinomycetota bacterium]